MIWYLLTVLYLLGALATSLPAVVAMMRMGGYASMDQMDREDWGTLVAVCVLWPLAWLGSAWYAAARAYARADTARRLRGLGADIEEDPDRG